MFTAGICTIVTCTLLFSCSSSHRSASWKPWIGMLGAAVGGLQRDPAVGQRRADLHDRAAVAGLHPPQRGHRGVDVAEVADLGDPLDTPSAPICRRARRPT